jgi:hypothetical protein
MVALLRVHRRLGDLGRRLQRPSFDARGEDERADERYVDERGSTAVDVGAASPEERGSGKRR